MILPEKLSSGYQSGEQTASAGNVTASAPADPGDRQSSPIRLAHCIQSHVISHPIQL
jgi:hypothetical protein